jgi:murein DD-endopeptidase MepM/ murein hydrolase activator NlpD
MSRFPRLLVAAVAAIVLASGSLVATPPSAAVAATRTPHFLTLPFKVTKRMHIQQGNIWRGAPDPGHVHGGIDYINGTLDRSRTWKTFPVYAAAAGYACANLTGRKGCIEGTGNRVLITHTIKGRKYRTYYGHLEAIATRIPLGGKKTVYVRRGELLGYAGYSGDPCCVRHLHFQLFDPSWKTVDPYGIDGTRDQYPDPQGTNGIRNGKVSYWRTDPPTPTTSFIDRPVEQIPYDKPRSNRDPKPTPTPKPRKTPRPTRTAKPRRTPRPERTPKPTPRPTRTPRATPTPAPTEAVVRPGPSLIAAATASLAWWGRVVAQVLQVLRGL